MKNQKTQDMDRIDVAYVAHLARLHLTEDEVRKFQEQLQQIVAYVRKINQLETQDIEPTSHANSVTNVFRSDVVRAGLDRESVRANAPAWVNDQFLTPKIVE